MEFKTCTYLLGPFLNNVELRFWKRGTTFGQADKQWLCIFFAHLTVFAFWWQKVEFWQGAIKMSQGLAILLLWKLVHCALEIMYIFFLLKKGQSSKQKTYHCLDFFRVLIFMYSLYTKYNGTFKWEILYSVSNTTSHGPQSVLKSITHSCLEYFSRKSFWALCISAMMSFVKCSSNSSAILLKRCFSIMAEKKYF